MGFGRVQVTLNNDTLLARDGAQNVWHFRTPAGVAASSGAIESVLNTFYDSIAGFLSSVLAGSLSYKLFDLEDDEPRPPVDTWTSSSTVGAGNGLPNECAICLSFQGPPVAGFSQARRRGRLFLGPLDDSVVNLSTGDMRPTSTVRNTIVAAAEAVMDQVVEAGLIWSVFSPSTAGPSPWSAATLSDAFVTITNGWVDDAFDTVRSRGLPASTRTVFPV